MSGQSGCCPASAFTDLAAENPFYGSQVSDARTHIRQMHNADLLHLGTGA